MVQLFTEKQNVQAVRRQQQQLILTNMLRVRQPFFVVPQRGGSKPGKRMNINYHREAGAMLLDADYFNDDVTYLPKKFWRRFRMNKELFLKVVHDVREYDKYFMTKKDCTYTVNDYLRMTELTCTETLYRFCRAVIAVFAKDYLRAPIQDDTTRICKRMQQDGFLDARKH
ncbi:uncharacterized protein [Lolium perenne]|uniref:uncharacterized protein n=1 Tax=Lolium perenne TaxID=4522 RepID=UPI003A9A5B5B